MSPFAARDHRELACERLVHQVRRRMIRGLIRSRSELSIVAATVTFQVERPFNDAGMMQMMTLSFGGVSDL